MKHCIICNKQESHEWWKCCPKHTTEQGPDVVCGSCAKALHIWQSYIYKSPEHEKYVADGHCDSISKKKKNFCRFKARHTGTHMSFDEDPGSVEIWFTKDELPREEPAVVGQICYEHESSCSKTNFTEENARGLRTCLDCAGVFDALGNGVLVDDKRFDANYVPPVAS